MGWLDKIASRLATELDEGPLDSDDRVTLELARAYLDRGDVAEARARLSALRDKHPRVAEVLVCAGDIAKAAGDLDGAVVLYGKAADAEPSRATPWLALAQALLPLQRFEPALDAARRATALADNIVDAEVRRVLRGEAHAVRGRVALAQGRYETARREFDRAMGLGITDQRLVADHGRAMVHLDRQEGARWLLHTARAADASADLVLEAALVQPAPEVTAKLIGDFLSRSPDVTAAQWHRLRARWALSLAKSAERARAVELLDLFKLSDETVPRAARVDVAEAFAALEQYTHACQWAELSEPSPSGTPDDAAAAVEPHQQFAWALGACNAEALRGAGVRLRQSAPALAAQVEAALADPPDVEAVCALVLAAPTEAARACWSARLRPTVSEETTALALLQSLEQIVTPLALQPDFAITLSRTREALHRPLIVAVMGEFNAGKSSLVNALVQTPLAPVGVKPTTATLNVFRHGVGGAHVIYRSGKRRRLETSQVAPFLSTLAEEDAESIEAVEIFLPHAPLQEFEWVDTPGLNAPRLAHERLTKQFMSTADVAVWVLAAQQAGKATEVEVLSELGASHTPILAVLNKTDQLDPDDLPVVHQAVVQAIGAHVFAVINATLKQPPQAQAAASALMEALALFCKSRMFTLKQRAALVSLRTLIARVRDEMAAHAPRDESLELEQQAWLAVATQSFAAAQSVAAAFNTSLPQVIADVALGLHEAVTAGDAVTEESVIQSVTRQVQSLCEPLLSQLSTMPAPVQQHFRTAVQCYLAQIRGRLEGGLAAQAIATSSSSPAGRRRFIEQALPDPDRFLLLPWRSSLESLLADQKAETAQRKRALAAAQALHRSDSLNPSLNSRCGLNRHGKPWSRNCNWKPHHLVRRSRHLERVGRHRGCSSSDCDQTFLPLHSAPVLCPSKLVAIALKAACARAKPHHGAFRDEARTLRIGGNERTQHFAVPGKRVTNVERGMKCKVPARFSAQAQALETSVDLFSAAGSGLLDDSEGTN
jgi:tetratricopeptide (TPR) repeat protein/GTP-binding protein EngB required for normal cell division